MGVVGVLATSRSRRWSFILSVMMLVAAVVVEGLPSLGADFGGPPGLLLGGLVLLAGAFGLHLTAGRVALAVVGVGAVTTVGAVLDWLRPTATRTHLGEFVQAVLQGELTDVIGRKVSQNLMNLTSPALLTASVTALALFPLLAADQRGRQCAVGAGSTSSTRTPPASLGWMKLTRELLVPRFGMS